MAVTPEDLILYSTSAPPVSYLPQRYKYFSKLGFFTGGESAKETEFKEGPKLKEELGKYQLAFRSLIASTKKALSTFEDHESKELLNGFEAIEKNQELLAFIQAIDKEKEKEEPKPKEEKHEFSSLNQEIMWAAAEIAAERMTKINMEKEKLSLETDGKKIIQLNDCYNKLNEFNSKLQFLALHSRELKKESRCEKNKPAKLIPFSEEDMEITDSEKSETSERGTGSEKSETPKLKSKQTNSPDLLEPPESPLDSLRRQLSSWF